MLNSLNFERLKSDCLCSLSTNYFFLSTSFCSLSAIYFSFLILVYFSFTASSLFLLIHNLEVILLHFLSNLILLAFKCTLAQCFLNCFSLSSITIKILWLTISSPSCSDFALQWSCDIYTLQGQPVAFFFSNRLEGNLYGCSVMRNYMSILLFFILVYLLMYWKSRQFPIHFVLR
jgi:hypothetical protein